MSLFDILFGTKEEKKSDGLFSIFNNEESNDEELDFIQKEEIKKGNHNPWNFEEEDLEEDDYYSEDDE